MGNEEIESFKEYSFWILKGQVSNIDTVLQEFIVYDNFFQVFHHFLGTSVAHFVLNTADVVVLQMNESFYLSYGSFLIEL